jgi:hypothetical protein
MIAGLVILAILVIISHGQILFVLAPIVLGIMFLSLLNLD